MDVTLEDTSKVIALMRSMELYSSASYVKDMSDRISTLEAALATARGDALREAAQIALRYTGAFPAQRIADAIFIRAAQPQPEPEAGAS